MKLGVSYDDQGNITTLFETAQLHGDRLTLTYLPAKGEKHHILDVPEKLKGTPIEKLPEMLRVNLNETHPRLEPKA
jgi:hypothetical protein